MIIHIKSMIFHWLLIGSSLVAGSILLVMTVAFPSYLQTRVASGLTFAILGPEVLRTGDKATITWNTSVNTQKTYPFEKIEFCKDTTSKECTLLTSSAPNIGTATVTVPQIKAGSGYIRLTARDKSGVLISRVSSRKPVRVVAGTTPAAIPLRRTSNVPTLAPTGSRISVAQDGDYLLPLPSSAQNGKVELCKDTATSCKTLSERIQGTPWIIHIPRTMEKGNWFIRVLQRSGDGTLAQNVLYKRAVRIDAPKPRSEETTESSGGGGSGGGNGGDEESNPATPTPNPNQASATFMSPVGGAIVLVNKPLPVQVRLRNRSVDPYVCGSWFLDGKKVPANSWTNNKPPVGTGITLLDC